MPKACEHVAQVHSVVAKTQGCEECLASGDEWVHLRLCLTCGHVGCCDDSKNKHATKHFHDTNHPIIQSFETGEEWGWCYVDEIMFPTMRRYLRTNRMNAASENQDQTESEKEGGLWPGR